MVLEEDAACPLCMDVLDPDDQALFPCPCRYQVCLWCVHHIREQLNGKCPACRQEYKDENFVSDEAIKEEALKKQKDKEKEAKEAAQKAEKEAAAASKGPRKDRDRNAKKQKDKMNELSHVRIVQKSVVYVMGIAPSIAKAEILKRPEFFGQYGTLLKVSVNRAPISTGKGASAQISYSAYLTFETEEDAKTAMQAVDGFEVDHHTLRVTYGTTKYCQNFIRGVKCPKQDCTFLHELVNQGKDKKKQRGERGYKRDKEGQGYGKEHAYDRRGQHKQNEKHTHAAVAVASEHQPIAQEESTTVGAATCQSEAYDSYGQQGGSNDQKWVAVTARDAGYGEGEWASEADAAAPAAAAAGGTAAAAAAHEEVTSTYTSNSIPRLEPVATQPPPASIVAPKDPPPSAPPAHVGPPNIPLPTIPPPAIPPHGKVSAGPPTVPPPVPPPGPPPSRAPMGKAAPNTALLNLTPPPGPPPKIAPPSRAAPNNLGPCSGPPDFAPPSIPPPTIPPSASSHQVPTPPTMTPPVPESIMAPPGVPLPDVPPPVPAKMSPPDVPLPRVPEPATSPEFEPQQQQQRTAGGSRLSLMDTLFGNTPDAIRETPAGFEKPAGLMDAPVGPPAGFEKPAPAFEAPNNNQRDFENAPGESALDANWMAYTSTPALSRWDHPIGSPYGQPSMPLWGEDGGLPDYVPGGDPALLAAALASRTDSSPVRPGEEFPGSTIPSLNTNGMSQQKGKGKGQGGKGKNVHGAPIVVGASTSAVGSQREYQYGQRSNYTPYNMGISAALQHPSQNWQEKQNWQETATSQWQETVASENRRRGGKKTANQEWSGDWSGWEARNGNNAIGGPRGGSAAYAAWPSQQWVESSRGNWNATGQESSVAHGQGGIESFGHDQGGIDLLQSIFPNTKVRAFYNNR